MKNGSTNLNKKKTTDECFTPARYYDAVKDWAVNEYGIHSEICRPFYPDGDYEHFDYSGKIVIDNPPFSQYQKILNFYTNNEIAFFLFAPALTLFKYMPTCFIITNTDIIYTNGAKVKTAFVTNLEPPGIRTAPDLTKTLRSLKPRKGFRKTELPGSFLSSAHMLKYWRTPFKIPMEHIEKKVSKTPEGKQIYGGALVLKDEYKDEMERIKEKPKPLL